MQRKGAPQPKDPAFPFFSAVPTPMKTGPGLVHISSHHTSIPESPHVHKRSHHKRRAFIHPPRHAAIPQPRLLGRSCPPSGRLDHQPGKKPSARTAPLQTSRPGRRGHVQPSRAPLSLQDASWSGIPAGSPTPVGAGEIRIGVGGGQCLQKLVTIIELMRCPCLGDKRCIFVGVGRDYASAGIMDRPYVPLLDLQKRPGFSDRITVEQQMQAQSDARLAARRLDDGKVIRHHPG
jgi:hypothetical protein